MLDSPVESLPTARVLLQFNYGPEYQHGWVSKSYYTQLGIDPLPPENAEELLQALLGADGGLQPLKQLLIARTDGNPFSQEESVRMLVETQVLVGEGGPTGWPRRFRASRCRPRSRRSWRPGSAGSPRGRSASFSPRS